MFPNFALKDKDSQNKFVTEFATLWLTDNYLIMPREQAYENKEEQVSEKECLRLE